MTGEHDDHLPYVVEVDGRLEAIWPGGRRPDTFTMSADAFDALVDLANGHGEYASITTTDVDGTVELVGHGTALPHYITHAATLVWLAALTIAVAR